MFTIALAWVKTGLARRFALWMISLAETDSARTVYVFVIGTGLVSTVVSDVPAAAIFMAIAFPHPGSLLDQAKTGALLSFIAAPLAGLGALALKVGKRFSAR